MGASQSTQKDPQQPHSQETEQNAITAQPTSDTDAAMNTAPAVTEGAQEGAQQAQSTTSEAAATGASAELASSSTTTTEGGDVFKVPSLPAAPSSASASTTSPSSTLRALPADIEHILSLNAHEPDEALVRAAEQSGREASEVVREMKERALRGGGGGEIKMEEGVVLRKVEEEMEAKGITREGEVKLEEVDEEMKTDGVKKEEKDDKMEDNDSSSDSDSSDGGASDSSSDLDLSGPAQRGRRGRGGANKGKATADFDDGDDDFDDDESVGPGGKVAPKTEHELADPDAPIPQVALDKIDAQAEIVKFGKVESVIENVVVLRAETAGDWRVLDEGTIVCWEDKTVIGAIFETFGSVQQPFYSLRFPPSSLPLDPSIFSLQKPVFYCPTLAQFVFTRDLRNVKGSDASNIWDEEVGQNEVEFSDDEEEAEYKRRLKADRRNRTQSATPGPSGASSSRAPSTAPPPRPPQPRQPTGGSYLPPAHLPARPAVSYADTDADPISLPYSGSSSSSAHTAPMAGPRADMGQAPPPGRVGRRMFERDTGRSLAAGEEVEFEFSSGDEDGGEGASDGEGSVAGSERGGERGFGAPRGGAGGRGARGGRGGRGGGGGNERGGGGRGRGGRGGGRGGGGGRHVAPLPARASPRSNAGLPIKPSFQSDLPAGPEGGIDAPVRMSAPPPPVPSAGPAFTFGAGAPPAAAAGSFAFGAQGGSPAQQHQQQQAARSPPFAQQQRPPPQQHQPMPWSSSHQPSYPQQHPQQHQQYHQPPYSPSYASSGYPSPSAAAAGGPSYARPPASAYYASPAYPSPGSSSSSPYPSSAHPGHGGGQSDGYSPHHPYATAPSQQQQQQGQGQQSYNPIVAPGGGHVNPRFLAQQQQQQQSGQGGQGGPPGGGYYGGQGGGYGGGWGR
ncbi:hypothetical protein JCM6882_003348 [Rhodosporidiobolus microsporus]